MEVPTQKVLFKIEGQKLTINLVGIRVLLTPLVGRNLYLIGKPQTSFKYFPEESVVSTSAIQTLPGKFVCKLTDIINSLVDGLEKCKSQIEKLHLGFKATRTAIEQIDSVIHTLKEASNSYFRFKSTNRTVAFFVDDNNVQFEILTGPEEQ